MLEHIILRDHAISQWLEFSNPVDVLLAQRPADVLPVIRAAERRVRNEGLYAAGFVTYEAAAGFDEALTTHEGRGLPLVCFGLFDGGQISDEPEQPQAGRIGPASWRLAETASDYTAKIHRIKQEIAAGNTYQINYTLWKHGAGIDSPAALFQFAAADAPYAAFVECENETIVSASPELFFRLDEGQVICKPMKGTAKRGLTTFQDDQLYDALRHSGKDRAENVMILDMVRNDLGRIAIPGSVEVTELYGIEKYPTVWQMTSTVAAETDAGIAEIFSALFPSASVTGAPKVSSMEIIHDLEDSPRGIYTGAIGYFGPGLRAQFNVAIRTAVIDKQDATAVYGVGSGIVWDSDPIDEYNECLTKARVLFNSRPVEPFELVETMLWSPEPGYVLLGEHLDRLCSSARYFDYAVDRAEIEAALKRHAASFTVQRQRVRLLLFRDGSFSITHKLIRMEDFRRPRKIALAAEPIDRDDVFLYHKTTCRQIYEDALAAVPHADDVLLWNRAGYITETSIANVAIDLSDVLYTPPTEDGLLAGTYRNWMLKAGMVRERSIHVDELAEGDELILFNSVRGQYKGILQIEDATDSAVAESLDQA